MVRLGLASEAVTHIEDTALSTPGGDPGVRVIALSRRLSKIAKDLDASMRGLNK